MTFVYSSRLHTSFPVTKYDHNVISRSTIFSKRHNKTKITSRDNNNPINVTPLGNSFITTSCIKIRNRPTLCVTKQTSGSTDMNLEPEKKPLKWDLVHETNLLWFLGMIVLGACAPFFYDPDAVFAAVVLSLMSGYGLTLGYHRLLSHRGFKVPKWLEYLFAYCGAHAVQRDPIFWVKAHKLHHKYSDTDKDPYTPTEGVWCSYLGWFLYNDYIRTKCEEDPNVSELKAQWFYQFLQDTYFWHPTALAILLYLYGGFPYLAWVMGVRVTALYLFTLIPFYVVHKWGTRPWNTPDTSTNSWWVSLLCLGDGWHNNHHAFPRSARHGLEWWQLDLTWEMIKFLKLFRLAADIKVPTEADKLKRKTSLGSSQTNR